MNEGKSLRNGAAGGPATSQAARDERKWSQGRRFLERMGLMMVDPPPRDPALELDRLALSWTRSSGRRDAESSGLRL